MKPIADRLVIERIVPKKDPNKLIELPDEAKEKPLEGKVIAKGWKVSNEISVDNTVLFGKYAGTEVTIKGKDYLILKQDELLAVL